MPRRRTLPSFAFRHSKELYPTMAIRFPGGRKTSSHYVTSHLSSLSPRKQAVSSVVARLLSHVHLPGNTSHDDPHCLESGITTSSRDGPKNECRDEFGVMCKEITQPRLTTLWKPSIQLCGWLGLCVRRSAMHRIQGQKKRRSTSRKSWSNPPRSNG